MIKSNEKSLTARLRNAALVWLPSMVVVPLCAYLGGSIVVGDYEGQSGLLGYLGAIYGDALSGRWYAWILILAPALIIATWAIALRVRRHGTVPVQSKND